MTLRIELTPNEEARLQAAAKTNGVPPAEFARKLLTEHLPPTQQSEEEDAAESLEAAIARMTHRSPQEIASVRERILAATPPPRELPEGKTLLEVVMGQWPGDETDEQIRTALEILS